ncbi:MAG: non-homologous end joining protein Ku [Betaproteobacteria bacterium]
MPEKRATKAPVRAFWSGTLTFGLVSIPVDLFAAVRGRHTALKLADTKGHALGREYYSDEHEEALAQDELVRGYETDDGKMVVVTDEELESVAPEMTRDIELRVFAPKDDIAPARFVRPYFLAPSGRSQKAYQLLARVMGETGRVGVGTFVMRARQYLVAIFSDGAVLRAETLRFAGELRSPKEVGLPKRAKASAAAVQRFSEAIDGLSQDEIDREELSDRYAKAIEDLVEKKMKKHKGVVRMSAAEAEGEDDEDAGEGEVVDLMKLLKQRVAGRPTQRASARR